MSVSTNRPVAEDLARVFPATLEMATIGILIGVENLGYLFANGQQRRIIPEVLAGVVAVVVIALIIDLLLVLAGRMLMPWTRATSTRTGGTLKAAGA